MHYELVCKLRGKALAQLRAFSFADAMDTARGIMSDNSVDHIRFAFHENGELQYHMEFILIDGVWRQTLHLSQSMVLEAEEV